MKQRTNNKQKGSRLRKCSFTAFSFLPTQDGMLSKDDVNDMKFRVKDGEKNIWHGFISFDENNSQKIDSPDRCIALIKKTFRPFFIDAGFDPDNMDLMCSLHLDRPTHLHIHYCFWEKEP